MAHSIEEKLAKVLGGPVWATAPVLHVAALSAAGEVLRIRHDTPRSELDFFLLNAARARSDAILTTGRILREEPDLQHGLQGKPADVEGLTEWRRNVLGRREPPFLIVLCSGRELDPQHTAFAADVRPVVFTPQASVAALRRALPENVQVVGDAAPCLRRAMAFARDGLGAQTIAIEAGPGTALGLYEGCLEVDELWLSEFLEPGLADALRGPQFLEPASLDALLPARSREEHAQASGRWRFTRRSRQP